MTFNDTVKKNKFEDYSKCDWPLPWLSTPEASTSPSLSHHLSSQGGNRYLGVPAPVGNLRSVSPLYSLLRLSISNVTYRQVRVVRCFEGACVPASTGPKHAVICIRSGPLSPPIFSSEWGSFSRGVSTLLRLGLFIGLWRFFSSSFFVTAMRPLQQCHSCAPKSSSVKAGAIMKLRKRKQSAQHGSFGARATSRARVAATQHSFPLFCLHACLVVCACVTWRTAAIRSTHASNIYLPFGPF